MNASTKKTAEQRDYETGYYPSEIRLETLPHRIYLLSWKQNGNVRSRLLNKGRAFALVNDMNVDRRLREEVLKAFRAGEIK
jgi:hypothetical protein